jgi:hypothetical protein
MSKAETHYQNALIARIKDRLPGAFVTKNDPHEYQGIPDLLVLWRDKWAMLEVKIEEFADQQPNQGYYVQLFDGMSFAAFIYPENEEEVLSALQSAFGYGGETRAS